MTRTIFESDYVLVKETGRDDGNVAVFVGAPPDHATPTLVNGIDLSVSILEALAEQELESVS